MLKPHLLLLPGLDGTGQLFKPLVEALGGGVEVETLSYPLDKPLGYDELLNLVTSRIVKGKPYLILGESFSGPLAVMAASRNPDNLLGVILAGSFVTSPVPKWAGRFKKLLRSPTVDLRPGPFIIDRLLGRDCPEKTRAWVKKTMPRLDRNVLTARIEAILEVNVREDLKSVEAPLMYIAGSRDWLVGKKSIDAIWLCRPDVEIRVLEGGHMILQTRPEEAAGFILSFCGKVRGQNSSMVARGHGSVGEKPRSQGQLS